MSYIPIRIANRREEALCSKLILLVNLLWERHSIEEATWELEDEIQEKYPNIFDS